MMLRTNVIKLLTLISIESNSNLLIFNVYGDTTVAVSRVKSVLQSGENCSKQGFFKEKKNVFNSLKLLAITAVV
jgi:hypothetical protein